MCGRIFCNLDPATIAHRLQLKRVSNADLFSPSCNITPSTCVPVLRSVHSLDFVNWAYKIPDSYFVLNARFEELHEKPLFKPCLDAQRCAIVCQGFYEWQQDTKVPFAYRYADEPRLMLIAALLLHDNVVLLTREATADVAHIHDRMPVILENERVLERWLSGVPFETVKRELNTVSDWSETLDVFAVAPHVSQVRNKSETMCLMRREAYEAEQKSKGIMRYFKKIKKEDEQ